MLDERHPARLDLCCELRQMLTEGLITSSQFHGVEKDAPVQAANTVAMLNEFPVETARPHLYAGDLVRVFDAASASKDFRPALVNIDTPVSPKYGFEPLAGVLAVLNCLDYPVMVVWNVVVEDRLKGKHRNNRGQLERFRDHEFLHHTLERGTWRGYGQYAYDGTATHSVSKMMSHVFWNGFAGKQKRQAV